MSKIPRGAVVVFTYDQTQYQGRIVEVLQSGMSVKVRFQDGQGVKHEIWRLAKEVKVVVR